MMLSWSKQRTLALRNRSKMKHFAILFGLIATIYAQGQPSVPCGVPTVQPKSTRIVGGQIANPSSWPWTVLMADSIGFISGTGAIIHPNIIISSAQHFEGPGYTLYDLDLHYWRIYAGEYNISTDDPNEKYYHINRVILHPGYNSTSLENDLAIIITKETIQFNADTRPACLPDATHRYTVGEMCYLPGWGSTSSTGNEEVMNQVAMPILDDAVCQSHWQDFIPNTEVCAGYENGGKDFCSDDIGSPLMCKDQSGAWYIQGLASSGGDCAKADEPGVFEDVSQYSDWIKQQMRDANFPYQY